MDPETIWNPEERECPARLTERILVPCPPSARNKSTRVRRCLGSLKHVFPAVLIMLSLVAIQGLLFIMPTVLGQAHHQSKGMHMGNGQFQPQSSTGVQSLQMMGTCSCQIRCCADHTSLRRLPPYTNQPHVYHATCCGCVYCPSFIGPGPFYPLGMPMLTPLASIQMAMYVPPSEEQDTPDQPDVPDVPDAPEIPEGQELKIPDPPEIEGPEIKSPEENDEQDNVES